MEESAPDRVRLTGWAVLVGLAMCCALAVVVLGIIAPIATGANYVADFTVFWTAARFDLDMVYNAEALTQAQAWLSGDNGLRPFAYPPTFLLLISPFGLLPYHLALLAWAALSLVAFAWAANRIVSWPLGSLVLLSPAVAICLHMGQSSLIVGGLLIAGMSFLPKQRAMAGVLFGLAAAFKPQSVLLLPLALIVAKEWRALGIAIAAGTCAGVISLIIHGPQLWLDWLLSLGGFMRIVEDLDLLKEGLGPASLVIALGLSGTAATALKLGCAALGLLTIIRVFKMPESTVIRLGALVSGGFLCSPYAMRYEAVLLQPIAVALLLERKAHPATWLAPFLCFTTLFLWAAPVLMGLTILFMTRAKQDSRHVMTPALDAPSSELQRQTQGAG